MELREYMSVRRAYNLVRQHAEADSRLSFEEFAVLCRLRLSPVPLKTSDIASYQGALRPTMTHRTNHLEKLGLIERTEGMVDRRNIVCAISARGEERLEELCGETRDVIPAGYPLARTSAERICKYVDAMGSVYCTAGGLIMLDLSLREGGASSVTGLVNDLGLLQPTVSMSVRSLLRSGKLERVAGRGGTDARMVRLSPTGAEMAGELAERISQIVVRRKPRAPRNQQAEAGSELSGML